MDASGGFTADRALQYAGPAVVAHRAALRDRRLLATLLLYWRTLNLHMTYGLYDVRIYSINPLANYGTRLCTNADPAGQPEAPFTLDMRTRMYIINPRLQITQDTALYKHPDQQGQPRPAHSYNCAKTQIITSYCVYSKDHVMTMECIFLYVKGQNMNFFVGVNHP
jgi:hypothetical protein